MENKFVTLKSWRKGTGRTVADVSRELGISRQAYGRYESGCRVPGNSVLNKIVVMTNGMVTANAWLSPEAAEIAALADGVDIKLLVNARVDDRLAAIRNLIDELMDKETAHVVLERLKST